MSDLIEREAVLDAICGFCKFETDTEMRKACTNCLDVKKIKAIPTIDAVSVVRCKYCEWYNGRYCFNEKSCFPKAPNADDFCSYGERRDDEGHNIDAE